jgi:hypothetical protein
VYPSGVMRSWLLRHSVCLASVYSPLQSVSLKQDEPPLPVPGGSSACLQTDGLSVGEGLPRRQAPNLVDQSLPDPQVLCARQANLQGPQLANPALPAIDLSLSFHFTHALRSSACLGDELYRGTTEQSRTRSRGTTPADPDKPRGLFCTSTATGRSTMAPHPSATSSATGSIRPEDTIPAVPFGLQSDGVSGTM